MTLDNGAYVKRLVCRLFGHKWLWYGPTFRFDECQRCGCSDGEASDA